MTTAFDHIAHQYDDAFTWSPIGLMQRKLVWNFLEKSLTPEKSLKILELNCGTGEDAVWLAQHNHQVWATDISEEMVKVAQHKAQLNNVRDLVQPSAMDILESVKKMEGKKFDLVFSNFGGINCLAPHELALWMQEQLPVLLNTGGKLIAVIMPRFCAWESLYFLSRFRFRKAFRRLSKRPVVGKLSEDASVNTWYYSPKWIQKNLPEGLAVTAVKPIGVFIPPSYLNGFFNRRKKFLQLLEKWENKAGHKKAAAAFSDHYLIEIQLMPQ